MLSTELLLCKRVSIETIRLSLDSVDSRFLKVCYMICMVDITGRTNGFTPMFSAEAGLLITYNLDEIPADGFSCEKAQMYGGEKNRKHNWHVGTLNVGTMKGKASEVVEIVSHRRVDLCCLQETRWKMEGFKQIVAKDSRYKLFWSGNDNATGGVGVLLAEEWWEKVVEVVRVSDRIILIRMTIGKTVFVFVCVYAPQANLSEFEKDRFYQMLLIAAMHSSQNQSFRTALCLW